jgi:hypothetical protein
MIPQFLLEAGNEGETIKRYNPTGYTIKRSSAKTITYGTFFVK